MSLSTTSKPLRSGLVALVVEHQVAVAIGKCDLKGRLVEQARAPARVLLRRVGVGAIEGGPLTHRLGLRKVVGSCEATAPVELLEFAAGVNADDIGDVAAVEAECFGIGIEGLGHGAHRGGDQQER